MNQKEQNWAENIALHTEGDADAQADRSERTPEDRIADTGEWSHQRSLDRIDGRSVEIRIGRCFFFHRYRDALNKCRTLRRDVIEYQMPLHRFLEAFRIVLIDPAQMRNHGIAEAQSLLTFIIEAALQAARAPETAHEFFLFHFSCCHCSFPLYSLAFR